MKSFDIEQNRTHTTLIGLGFFYVRGAEKNIYPIYFVTLGFPDGCSNLSEKYDYLEKLRQECSFGEEFDIQQIEKNPPRVTVSKLSANALVGKLGKKYILIAPPSYKKRSMSVKVIDLCGKFKTLNVNFFQVNHKTDRIRKLSQTTKTL